MSTFLTTTVANLHFYDICIKNITGNIRKTLLM